MTTFREPDDLYLVYLNLQFVNVTLITKGR